MNLFKAIKLLLNPDLWETASPRAFDDELVLIDGPLRFFSECSVNFRDTLSREIVYEFPALFWPIMLILSARLDRLVKKREMLEHNKN